MRDKPGGEMQISVGDNNWLRTDVAAAYDKLKSDPSLAASAKADQSRLDGRRERTLDTR
jgi:hypothetical protein